MSHELEIRRSGASGAATWDAFVEASKNGTYLFQRGFMGYHADRFDDHSVIVFEGGSLLAVLPANRVDDALVSHGGLTYGGIVMGAKIGAARMLAVFDALTGICARRASTRFATRRPRISTTINRLTRITMPSFATVLHGCAWTHRPQFSFPIDCLSPR